MKRVLFPLLWTALFAGALPAQNRAPSWYLDREADYPSSRYISAVGEGASRAQAEIAAVAGVSLFFNTSTQIRNDAIREFNEVVSDDASTLSKKTYVSENAVIRSEEEFLGVRFADSFRDETRGTWTALAYIDRQEAAGIYSSRIAANMAALRALAADGAAEAEPLYACGLLNKAVRIGDFVEECIKIAVVVDPQARAVYARDITAINEARSAYRSGRTGLSFGISVTSPENSGRIGRKLQQLLESGGYTVTARNPRYTVFAVLSAEEEVNATSFVVRPGLTVTIERGEEAFFSYGKNYTRFTSLSSASAAYNRALLTIEKDLEENFITQFSAVIGK